MKNKKTRASIVTLISKIFINRKNNLEYDAQFDTYWQKHNDTYLQIDHRPIYDFSYKRYEKRFYSMYCRKYVVKTGDVIVDLGAGVGAELPYYIPLIGEEGHVYAIEASPDSFKKMQELSKRNQYTNNNISLFCLAISDAPGSVWIEETTSYRANQINKDHKGIEVEALTLDAFVEKQGIKKINLLKMNIEGAEIHVIKGMDASIHLVENFANILS